MLRFALFGNQLIKCNNIFVVVGEKDLTMYSLGQLKLPSQNKPVLALLIHDIPQRTDIVESFSTTTKQSYYILLIDFQIRQNEAWVITNLQRFAPVLKVLRSC